MNALTYYLKSKMIRSGLLLALVCFLLVGAPAWAADLPDGFQPQALPTLTPGQVDVDPQGILASTPQVPTIVTVTRMEARPNTSPAMLLAMFIFLAVLFGVAWLTRDSGKMG